MRDEGTFRGAKSAAQLDTVFSVASGLSVVAGLPAGILFDKFGPKALAWAGSLAAAVCLALMAASLQLPALNDWLFIWYPAATVCSMLSTWGGYAFLGLRIILHHESPADHERTMSHLQTN